MVDVLGLQDTEDREYVDESGVRLIFIPVPRTRHNRIRYLMEYGATFLWFTILISKLYFKNRYDAIHIHNMPNFLVFCAVVPKLFGAKIILDIHDLMPEVYKSKFKARDKSLVMRLLRIEEKLSSAFADTVITANIHFKNILVERGLRHSKVTVVQNFPDPEIFQKSRRPIAREKNHDRFTMIFPGTIAPRYGLEIVVRALPLLKEEIPTIHLWIIGRQDEHAHWLRTLAEQLEVSELVTLEPSVANKKIPSYLARSDIGIYPALPDCHMSIAIPGKVLEFAMMGLPIISSRLQIVEEMFDDSAVLFFEPGNIEQFALCVLRLYRDPRLRGELVRRADQALNQQPCWEKEAHTFMALLSRLLDRGDRTPATE